MISSQFTILFSLTVAFGIGANTAAAFTVTSQSRCQRLLDARHGKEYRSLNVLNSSPDPNMQGYDDNMEEGSGASGGGDPSMSMPEQPPPAQYVPPTPTRNSPPAVRQQRMDPLMASLTKDDSGATPDGPTQTVPIFGEIPADGTLLLLAPAVVFAVLGFLFSFVIAFQSADQIVVSIGQTGESIAQTAQNRNNRVYDKDVCRGLCSSQEKDIDGMRNFMEFITKGAREGQNPEPVAIEEPVAPVIQQLTKEPSAPVTEDVVQTQEPVTMQE